MAKKKKKKPLLAVVITVIIAVIAIAWYFGGKPQIEIGAEGIDLVQTEEPLLKTLVVLENESVVPEPVEGPAL